MQASLLLRYKAVAVEPAGFTHHPAKKTTLAVLSMSCPPQASFFRLRKIHTIPLFLLHLKPLYQAGEHMWSLGTHENLLWPLFFNQQLVLTDGFGRGINSSSLSSAEEPC